MSQQQMSDTKWFYGTVKWFDAVKGYGFITVDDGSDQTDGGGGQKMRGGDRGGGGKNDVFVHISALSGSHAGQKVLGDGDKVKFHIDTREDRSTGKKRTSAIDVSVVPA